MNKRDIALLLAGTYLLSKRRRKSNPDEMIPSMELMLHNGLTLDEVNALRRDPLFVDDEDIVIEMLELLPRYYMGTDESGEEYYLINTTPHSMNFVRRYDLHKNPRSTSLLPPNLSREYVKDNFVYVKGIPPTQKGISQENISKAYPTPYYRRGIIPKGKNDKSIVVDGVVIDAQMRDELGLLDLGTPPPKRYKQYQNLEYLVKDSSKAKSKPTRKGTEYVDVPASGIYFGQIGKQFPPGRFPTLTGGGLNIKRPKMPIPYVFFQDPLRRGKKRKNDFYAYGKLPSPQTLERFFPNTYFVTSRIQECLPSGLIYPFIFPGSGKKDFTERNGQKYTKKFYFADMICEVLRNL